MSWGKGSKVAASGSLGLPLSFSNPSRTCRKVWYLDGWEGMRMIKITHDFENRFVLQRTVCLLVIVLAAWARLSGWESESERWGKNTKEQKTDKRENKMKKTREDQKSPISSHLSCLNWGAQRENNAWGAGEGLGKSFNHEVYILRKGWTWMKTTRIKCFRH